MVELEGANGFQQTQNSFTETKSKGRRDLMEEQEVTSERFSHVLLSTLALQCQLQQQPVCDSE